MKKIYFFIASLFIAIGAMAQTTTIDVAKTYTLECQSGASHSTTRFIGVTDGVINGQSATGAEITFEAAEEGSYYIKVGDKYINHDGTAISASAEASTAWVLGTVNNLVTFKVPETTLYLNNNGSDCTDGTVTNLKGNNHASGPTTNNACSTWAMVEYVAPEEGGEEETTTISSLADFKPNKYYTVSTDGRGGWAVNNDGTQFCSTNDAGFGTNVDAANTQHQFAILSADGTDYYLYSIHAQKFIKADRTMVAGIADAIAITDASSYNGENRFRVNFRDVASAYINLGGSKQMTVDGWSSIDDGNAVLFTEAGDWDSSAALAMLSDVVTVKYNFVYNGETKYTQEATVSNGDNLPAITVKFPYGVSATAPTGTVNKEEATNGVITKDITLTVELPFTISTSYADATWYYMTIREGQKYVAKSESTPYSNGAKVSDDNGLWAITGNVFDGVQLINKAAGDGYTLGFDSKTSNSNIYMKEGSTTWSIEGYSNGFLLRQGENEYAHDMSSKLQFWNSSWASTDAGSVFQFEEPLTIAQELEALIAEYEAMGITAGTNIGDYTEEGIAEFNAAIEAAKAVGANATEDDMNTLRAAYENIAVVLPDPNKFYTFNCVYEGRVLRINENNQMNYEASGYNTSKAVFQFEAGSKGNTVKIKSVHTQSYMGEISGNITFDETGAEITIARSNSNEITDETQKATAVMFTTDGVSGIHANRAPVIAYDNIAISNHYILTEVSEFSHTLTVSDAGLATLVLGFNATIPAGVECYYAAEAIDENGVLNLTKVEGTLPANTPVIVKLAEGYAAGSYEFAYTTEAGNTPAANLLSGTLYTKDMTVTGSVYVLAVVDGNVGLYQDYLTDGVFRNNANKTYLELTVSTAASYSFNFDWAGTTGVEGVVAEGAENGAIYDITGRRVKAIVAPGLYIVNGQKIVK